MNTPRTSIRLIEPDDAETLAVHLGRDAEGFARWDPERPPEFCTPAGQRSRIESMLMQYHSGEVRPGVVLSDDVVIGQVTVQNILRRVWRKAELDYWIVDPYQGQGHATRAVSQAVEMMTTELALHRAEALTQMDNLGSDDLYAGGPGACKIRANQLGGQSDPHCPGIRTCLSLRYDLRSSYSYHFASDK